MITDLLGKRIGLDPTSRKFVNEIAGAQAIERESSATYVLPYPSSSGPYKVMLSGKTAGITEANLSITGRGFVAGVRNLKLKQDEAQKILLWPIGIIIGWESKQDGPTPQILVTTQSDRTQPSYRFELSSSSLSRGKDIWVELDRSKGGATDDWLSLGSNDTKRISFTVAMRRTNPDGSRNSYTQHDVSFGPENFYRMDFGKWDGKGEIRFCQAVGSVAPCTLLKNETSTPSPN